MIFRDKRHIRHQQHEIAVSRAESAGCAMFDIKTHRTHARVCVRNRKGIYTRHKRHVRHCRFSEARRSHEQRPFPDPGI